MLTRSTCFPQSLSILCEEPGDQIPIFQLHCFRRWLLRLAGIDLHVPPPRPSFFLFFFHLLLLWVCFRFFFFFFSIPLHLLCSSIFGNFIHVLVFSSAFPYLFLTRIFFLLLLLPDSSLSSSSPLLLPSSSSSCASWPISLYRAIVVQTCLLSTSIAR